MKNIVIILLFSLTIFACKKEKLPPQELIGKWEKGYGYVEVYFNDTILYTRYDTYPNPSSFLEFRNDYQLITPVIAPCNAIYSLVRNNNYIQYYFPCWEDTNLENNFFIKIYKLTTDTLIIEETSENAFSRSTYIKVN